MAKIPLSQQLASLELMKRQWVNTSARKAGMRAQEVQHTLEAVDQIRVTLEWLQTHEQTIRDAISSARSLDASQPVP